MTLTQILAVPLRLAIIRRPLRHLTIRRLFLGGRLSDAGRLPRYCALFALGAAAIWAPIMGYLSAAPLKFSSHLSLILPGSGASSSVNLNNIGQASSYANSAFSSSSVSPTETYKRLLVADRVIRAAAAQLNITAQSFGEPRVQLVDQTAFIHVELTAPTPEMARDKGNALLSAFFSEIDLLRKDEMTTREDGGLAAIQEYKLSVASTREEIARLQRETGLYSSEQHDRQVEAHDELRRNMEVLQTELKRKEGAVDRLEARLGTDARRAALILLLNADSAYLAQLEGLAREAAALTDAQARFGAEHPKVVDAQAALGAARRAVARRAVEVTGEEMVLERMPTGGHDALLTDLVRQEADRNGLAKQLASLTAQFEAQAEHLEALAPAAARLEDMQRDFNVAEAVFASAIARTQSSKTDIYASYPLVQVLEDPSLPAEPSSPRRALAIAAGVAACFMLFVALVLAWVRQPVISFLLSRNVGER